ncbi:DUF4269 domain-containing protein [Leptospira gomenensis]|uniref:DUF4269 domain-containing protein n=1 Tax=Leptospira gomenensis TaxID=2484974 RepID=UPI0014384DD3|nr:DUF4269 domain-containing protein [Leptospira gomenensis]
MDTKPNFSSPNFLKNGNLKQRKIWEEIKRHSIFDSISKYGPVFAGTVPLEIDIDESDVDILCSYKDSEEFKLELGTSFSRFYDFEIEEKNFQNLATIITRFRIENFKYEIFAQPIPVESQMGFVHMIVEHRILTFAVPEFGEKIKDLKLRGRTTEQAFCDLLRIDEDPYEYLFELRTWSDPEIKNLILQKGF